MVIDIKKLKDLHKGKNGVIIGCGESDFSLAEEKVVICINDSIRKYNQIADFWITQHSLHLREIGFISPKKTKIILPLTIDGGKYSLVNFENILIGYDCYYFWILPFGFDREIDRIDTSDEIFIGHLTFHFAINLAKLLGLKMVELIGFNKTKRLAEGDPILVENTNINMDLIVEGNLQGEKLLKSFGIVYEYK